jgi:penicillin amidase
MGGLFTVNVANAARSAAPMTGQVPDFAFLHGPSIRCVFEASPNGFTMSYELPGGADLHRDSPFYNNLLPLWLDNQPIDFPFGPGTVQNPPLVYEVRSSP